MKNPAPLILLAACGAADATSTAPTTTAEITVDPPSSRIPAASASANPRAQSKPASACYAEPVQFDDPKLAPKPLTPDPAITLTQCEAQPQRSECRYSVARAFFEAHRFERAAPLFLEIALDSSSGDVAPYAAQLGLESLNVLGSRASPARASCYTEITGVLPKLVAALCEPAPRAGGEETCDLLARIGADITRLRAETLVKEADADPAERSERYTKAGDEYLALARARCIPQKNVKPILQHCDEILYNAYRAYKAAKNHAKAKEAKDFLLHPKNGLQKTELAKKVAKEP